MNKHVYTGAVASQIALHAQRCPYFVVSEVAQDRDTFAFRVRYADKNYYVAVCDEKEDQQ